MQEVSTLADDKKQAQFIRLGGLSVLVGLTIHIVVNMVLKEFPPEDPSLAELHSYLLDEAGTWALVHGLRYVALAGLLLFSASLFIRTCGARVSSSTGWGIVGLLGTSIHVANAFITNGIETLAFLDFSLLSEKPELFWLVFNTTRVLFTAEIAAWAVVIFGFSMAGLQSSMLPKWIVGLGMLSSTASILSGVFIVSILTDGWAVMLIEIAALTGLAWFACVGIYMMLRGSS